jgi:hypothetical protein
MVEEKVVEEVEEPFDEPTLLAEVWGRLVLDRKGLVELSSYQEKLAAFAVLSVAQPRCSECSKACVAIERARCAYHSADRMGLGARLNRIHRALASAFHLAYAPSGIFFGSPVALKFVPHTNLYGGGKPMNQEQPEKPPAEENEL